MEILNSHIKANGGLCLTLVSPVDVQLDCDDGTMVPSDLIVVCDRVYYFDQTFYPTIYGFDSKIPVGIFDDAYLVDFLEIFERVGFLYDDERR